MALVGRDMRKLRIFSLGITSSKMSFDFDDCYLYTDLSAISLQGLLRLNPAIQDFIIKSSTPCSVNEGRDHHASQHSQPCK